MGMAVWGQQRASAPPPYSASHLWLNMSTRGTIMRTPTPPCFAALPNVLEWTTCAAHTQPAGRGTGEGRREATPPAAIEGPAAAAAWSECS